MKGRDKGRTAKNPAEFDFANEIKTNGKGSFSYLKKERTRKDAGPPCSKGGKEVRGKLGMGQRSLNASPLFSIGKISLILGAQAGRLMGMPSAT